jgi:L-fucose isomerase-like protein
MTEMTSLDPHPAAAPYPWLTRLPVRLQPVLARPGRPNLDLAVVAEQLSGLAEVLPPVAIESPEHWQRVIRGLGEDVDGILPVSVPAYPTEVWNSHPQALVERNLPFVFWPLTAYNEPDFWRWSACDFLRALGVEVHLVRNARQGQVLARALAVRRLLRGSRMVVFGEQNFPWNAPAAGHLVTATLGTTFGVRPIRDIREQAARFTDADVARVWAERRDRYEEAGVRPDELGSAVRTYLGVRSILEEERALGFGVNCFGDLIPGGGRDVPCLAQSLLREDGFIASCDGDYLAMMSMALGTCFLDKSCMMSNMYPLRYVGALRDHFGDPLLPDPVIHPAAEWRNLARLAHCGFIGVVPPDMTPTGRVKLRDWGGTYEIHRDGRGCGIDGDLAPGRATVLELKFDGRTLLIADAEVLETTRHPGMAHCESTALLRFRDLEGFVADISREHTAIVFGDHADDFQQLATVLGLTARVY